MARALGRWAIYENVNTADRANAAGVAELHRDPCARDDEQNIQPDARKVLEERADLDCAADRKERPPERGHDRKAKRDRHRRGNGDREVEASTVRWGAMIAALTRAAAMAGTTLAGRFASSTTRAVLSRSAAVNSQSTAATIAERAPRNTPARTKTMKRPKPTSRRGACDHPARHHRSKPRITDSPPNLSGGAAIVVAATTASSARKRRRVLLALDSGRGHATGPGRT